jgi:hypothetical protein
MAEAKGPEPDEERLTASPEIRLVWPEQVGAVESQTQAGLEIQRLKISFN